MPLRTVCWLQCGAPFETTDMVTLNPNRAEEEDLLRAMQARRAQAKARKAAKKAAKKAAGGGVSAGAEDAPAPANAAAGKGQVDGNGFAAPAAPATTLVVATAAAPLPAGVVAHSKRREMMRAEGLPAAKQAKVSGADVARDPALAWHLRCVGAPLDPAPIEHPEAIAHLTFWSLALNACVCRPFHPCFEPPALPNSYT